MRAAITRGVQANLDPSPPTSSGAYGKKGEEWRTRKELQNRRANRTEETRLVVKHFLKSRASLPRAELVTTNSHHLQTNEIKLKRKS